MDRTGEGALMGPRLALLELHERDARAVRHVDVTHWPLTIGRALANDIVLDDPWVAPRHARISADDAGGLTLEVLDTRNGVLHDGARIASGRSLPLPAAGTTLQIGATRIRLRLPGEDLAPERALPGGLFEQRLRPALMALALAALLLAGHWLGLDPGADFSAWLPLLVGVPVLLVAWCGGWALVSKLFQHRFDFAGHLRIALPWMLAIGVADALLPQLAASLAAPWLWQLAVPLQSLLAALLVRAHLSHVLPLHQRAVSISVAALALLGAGLSVVLSLRTSDSLRSAPYMSTLPLPPLRMAGTVPTSALVQQMAPLAAKLAQRVKKARQDDEDDSGDAAE